MKPVACQTSVNQITEKIKKESSFSCFLILERGLVWRRQERKDLYQNVEAAAVDEEGEHGEAESRTVDCFVPKPFSSPVERN